MVDILVASTVTDNSHEADRDCPLHQPNPAEQKVNMLIPVDTNIYTISFE